VPVANDDHDTGVCGGFVGRRRRVAPFFLELREVRKLALGHPALDQTRIGAVESEDDDSGLHGRFGPRRDGRQQDEREGARRIARELSIPLPRPGRPGILALSPQARGAMLQDVLPETLPHSDDAERAVLGAVLLDNRQIHKVQELLGHEAFYAERHRRLFRAIEELSESGSALDLVTVRDALERGGDLDAVGGVGYLAGLVTGRRDPPTSSTTRRSSRRKSILRELIRAAQAILTSALRPQGSAEEVLDEAERAVFHVSEDRLKTGFLSMKTVGERSIKIIEDLTHRREPITGIPTGFVQLDEWTAGLQDSDLVILAARPSMGKTTFAPQHRGARGPPARPDDRRVLARDVPPAALLASSLLRARVDAHRLRTGASARTSGQRIIKAFAELSEAPMFIDDTPGSGSPR
jgi:replicative DNA helicase